MPKIEQMTDAEFEFFILTCEDCSCTETMQPCEACVHNAWLQLKSEEYKNVV